jgi:hypothetical protein
MNRLLSCLALLAAAFFLMPGAGVQAYPKPSINHVSWELDFTHGLPTRIAVTLPGADAPRAFWYMTFTVTNNSKDEQSFLPVFDLVDDHGNVHRSDQNIPKEVFTAIKTRERIKLLEPIAKASGRILVGPDQAHDSVAIWPEPIERMGTFSIFVSGLSGEAVWFKDGKETQLKDADWVKTKQEDAGEILRKTLQIDIQIPGDEFYQGRDRVIQKDERWVMR